MGNKHSRVKFKKQESKMSVNTLTDNTMDTLSYDESCTHKASTSTTTTTTTTTNTTGFAVVELFTSEGCSSCPPADDVLSELWKMGNTGLRIYTLSFHVVNWLLHFFF